MYALIVFFLLPGWVSDGEGDTTSVHKLCALSLDTLGQGFPEESRLRLEDFSYEEYLFVVGRYKAITKEFVRFAEMLARYSDSPEVYRSEDLTRAAPHKPLVITIPTDSLRNFSIVGWSMQNIGFHNFALRLEGYGLVTQERILRLQVENMNLKGADIDTVHQWEIRYRKVKSELEHLFRTRGWSD